MKYYQIQTYNNYKKYWDHFDTVDNMKQAREMMSNNIVYGLFRVLKTTNGHYRTVGYYQVDQEKITKLK